ncbi:hypothetical protein J0H58_31695 [bacterium]|nr:hypothetical protein [bacterium]
MANRADNFNRANGSLNGQTPSDGGSAWVCVTGGSVSGNAFAHAGGGGEYNALSAAASDVDVVATMSALPAAFGRGSLLARGSDSSNFWHVGVRCGSTPTTPGVWAINKRVAGTDTAVVSGTGPALGVGSRLRLNAVGDRLRIYHTPSGGSESLILDTGTGQTHNQSATAHGLGGSFNDSTVRWDDFAITDLGGGGGSVVAIVAHLNRLRRTG